MGKIEDETAMKFLAILAGVLMFGLGSAKAELKVGDPAPDFSAPSTSGTIRLSELVGKAPVIVYFYPKDDTPGCTKEACGLRDSFAAFRKLDATILGVSYDSVESHKKFAGKYKLPFALVSDAHKKIAKAYGADGLLFAKRKTFVIDKVGKIAWVNPDVTPATHSQELQDVLAKL
jgi:thioredoxin-dependent peroxiredoxin